MAIYPTIAPPNGNGTTPIDVEAWTEQATQALGSVAIDQVHGVASVQLQQQVTLEIPLDEVEMPNRQLPLRPAAASAGVTTAAAATAAAVTMDNGVRPSTSGYVQRKEPMRRDSMKRREALLKGKEGSRRRQRWENDRLLSNPYAQPPLPSDWEVRPTYPVFHVPYYLAPLWDMRVAAEKKKASSNRKGSKSSAAAATDSGVGRVPKELRERLKRSKAAKGLLQDLEEEVRRFVEKWDEREKKLQEDGMVDLDSDDEEIVFVGRNRLADDAAAATAEAVSASSLSTSIGEEMTRQKLLLDSPVDDQSASFGRWLVHHIGTYYGLETWSVTVGNPARREAYIGFRNKPPKTGHPFMAPQSPLPRPLWGLV